jgi:hypothetical protein
VKDERRREYHLDGHEEDKDLEVDLSEDRQEEVADHQEVGDRQQEYQCQCCKPHNQEDTTETN